MKIKQNTKPKSITPVLLAPPLEPSPGLLLTPAELAVHIRVPESWIREQTRQRARVRTTDPLPCVKLGKYTRFRLADVEAWIARR